MHSHLLPGIDDGVKTYEEAIEILKIFRDLGIKEVVTTPHIMMEYYPNTPLIINEKLAALQNYVNASDLDIKIDAAAEYYFDDHFKKLIQEPSQLLTFLDNFILVETPMYNIPPDVIDVFFSLRAKGITPILAHPERYHFIQNDISLIDEIKSSGTLIQVNYPSFFGAYGPEAQKTAQQLYKKKLIDFTGTDCHNIRQAQGLQQFL